MAYLNEIELKAIGFKSYGSNLLISDKASIHNAKNISIGSNVRIDDFCVISAGREGISIGSYVHFAPFVSIQGEESVIIEDFVGISSKVSIFSSSDDYFGYGMTNPMIPNEFKKVKSKPIRMCKHALIGAHSVILPGSYLDYGVSIGAMSVVTSKLEAWTVNAGNPAKKIVRRSKKILEKEAEFVQRYSLSNNR